MTFNFWRWWLVGVGAILVLFSSALAIFNQSPVFDLLFNDQIDPVFWQPDTMDPPDEKFQSWAYGVLGATLAGWGVMFTFVSLYAFNDKSRWVWICILLALCVWYITDTLISYSLGTMFNVKFNTVLFFLVLIPLGFTYTPLFRNKR